MRWTTWRNGSNTIINQSINQRNTIINQSNNQSINQRNTIINQSINRTSTIINQSTNQSIKETQSSINQPINQSNKQNHQSINQSIFKINKINQSTESTWPCVCVLLHPYQCIPFRKSSKFLTDGPSIEHTATATSVRDADDDVEDKVAATGVWNNTTQQTRVFFRFHVEIERKFWFYRSDFQKKLPFAVNKPIKVPL